jgi:hypothetical protein
LLNHAVNGEATLQRLITQLFIFRPVKVANETSVVRQQILIDAAFAERMPAWSGRTLAEKLVA